MPYLLDTSILARLANSADAAHEVAHQAVTRLIREGEALHICPQNLVEFRSVATRPTQANSLGLAPADEETLADAYADQFVLLEETAALHPRWKALVRSAGVTGKQVHDARLVAICLLHGVSHILTFNTPHFEPLAATVSSISVVHPMNV